MSCHGFRANDVRLQLFVLAYNLANFFRRLALPKGIRHWTLSTLQQKFVKIGTKAVKRVWGVVFQRCWRIRPKEEHSNTVYALPFGQHARAQPRQRTSREAQPPRFRKKNLTMPRSIITDLGARLLKNALNRASSGKFRLESPPRKYFQPIVRLPLAIAPVLASADLLSFSR